MRKLLFTYLICLFTFTASAQQYRQFSQFFSASLYLNPAFAGIYSSPTASTNYQARSSNGFSDNSSLAQVSVVLPLLNGEGVPKQFGGIGISADTRRGDFVELTGYFLTYAHTFNLSPVSPDKVIVSVKGGYDQLKVDFSEIQWVSQYNPFINIGFDGLVGSDPVTDFNSQSGSFTVSGGLMYFYNPERNYLLYNYSAFSGFSFDNLNRPSLSVHKLSSYRSPIDFKYHGGVEFKYADIYVQPSILVGYIYKEWQYDLGSIVTYATDRGKGFSLSDRGIELVAGAWYRFKDSFIFLVGVNDDNYSVKVSYDLNQNAILPNADNGNGLIQPALELSFKYVFGAQNRVRKISNPLF